MNWEEISFVTGNKIRFRSLLILKDASHTATQISKSTGFSVPHVSVALKLLSSKGLIRCQDVGTRKNKYYSITEKGIDLIHQLHKVTELI